MPKDKNVEMELATRKIVQTYRKNKSGMKVIDFRDSLFVANEEDFAKLYGTGGTGNAPASGIQCVICNTGKGRDYKPFSNTTKANIPISSIPILLKVAEQKMLNPPAAISDLTPNPRVKKTLKDLGTAYRQSSDNPKLQALIGDIGKTVRELEAELAATPKTTTSASAAWEFSIEKVNPYRIDANGWAPVTALRIRYQPYQIDNKTGKQVLHGNPWYFEVMNATGKVVEHENGTMHWNSVKDQVKCSINITAQEMYENMYLVNEFIQTWRESFCIPLVRKGEQRSAEVRQQFAESCS